MPQMQVKQQAGNGKDCPDISQIRVQKSFRAAQNGPLIGVSPRIESAFLFVVQLKDGSPPFESGKCFLQLRFPFCQHECFLSYSGSAPQCPRIVHRRDVGGVTVPPVVPVAQLCAGTVLNRVAVGHGKAGAYSGAENGKCYGKRSIDSSFCSRGGFYV